MRRGLQESDRQSHDELTLEGLVAQVEESTLKANRALDEALAAIKASLRRIDARPAGTEG